MKKIDDVFAYIFKHRLIYFILMLIATISCKKSTQSLELPPITESGNNAGLRDNIFKLPGLSGIQYSPLFSNLQAGYD